MNALSLEVSKAGLDQPGLWKSVPAQGRGHNWMILKVPSNPHRSVILQSELDQGSPILLQHVLKVTGKSYRLKRKLPAQNEALIPACHRSNFDFITRSFTEINVQPLVNFSS